MRAPGNMSLRGGTVGSGVAGLFATVVVWILGITLWGAPADADSYQKAVMAVPLPIAGVVVVVVAGAGTYVARWLTETMPEVAEAISDIDVDSLLGPEDEDEDDEDAGLNLDPDSSEIFGAEDEDEPEPEELEEDEEEDEKGKSKKSKDD